MNLKRLFFDILKQLSPNHYIHEEVIEYFLGKDGANFFSSYVI